jgi:hypothetical protein
MNEMQIIFFNAHSQKQFLMTYQKYFQYRLLKQRDNGYKSANISLLTLARKRHIIQNTKKPHNGSKAQNF